MFADPRAALQPTVGTDPVSTSASLVRNGSLRTDLVWPLGRLNHTPCTQLVGHVCLNVLAWILVFGLGR